MAAVTEQESQIGVGSYFCVSFLLLLVDRAYGMEVVEHRIPAVDLLTSCNRELERFSNLTLGDLRAVNKPKEKSISVTVDGATLLETRGRAL